MSRELLDGILPASIPRLVIGCIVTGVTTPTEAGALAALLVMMLACMTLIAVLPATKLWLTGLFS